MWGMSPTRLRRPQLYKDLSLCTGAASDRSVRDIVRGITLNDTVAPSRRLDDYICSDSVAEKCLSETCDLTGARI